MDNPRPGRPEPGSRQPVLAVDGLSVEFHSRRGVARAVRDVSFELYGGETLGLVGESGSGKTVTSMAVVGLLPAPAARVVAGSIRLRDKELVTATRRELQALRGRHIAMVLQNPLDALNPAFTIGNQLMAVLRKHTALRGKGLRDRAVELLRLLQIPAPEERLHAYPHQLSGGMRQRVVGAIALAGEPEVLIADEPTTALDVTVEAAYIELLRTVQDATGVSIMFITHDLGIVSDLCERVAVMYAGSIVEVGRTADLFEAQGHPYTKALLASIPKLQLARERLVAIPGNPPSPYETERGCPFRPRCSLYQELGGPDACSQEVPPLTAAGPDRMAACHFSDESLSGSGAPG